MPTVLLFCLNCCTGLSVSLSVLFLGKKKKEEYDKMAS